MYLQNKNVCDINYRVCGCKHLTEHSGNMVIIGNAHTELSVR